MAGVYATVDMVMEFYYTIPQLQCFKNPVLDNGVLNKILVLYLVIRLASRYQTCLKNLWGFDSILYKDKLLYGENR